MKYQKVFSNSVLHLVLATLTAGFCWVQRAQADEAHYLFYAYPLDLSIRYDKNDNQDYRRIDPRIFGIGIETPIAEMAFEVSTLSTDSSSGNIQIHRNERDYLIWARVPVLKYPVMLFFIGGAVGAYDESITTTVGAANSVSSSSGNWATGLNLGAQFLLQQNFLLSIEARSNFGKDFDPQPQFGGLLRIGLRI